MDERSEFSVTDLFFLFYLEDKKNPTYYQVSRDLPYNSSYISKTIKKLESKNFVTRETVENKKIIKLTPVAERALETRIDKKENFLEYLGEKGVSREEVISFFSTMNKFSSILAGTEE